MKVQSSPRTSAPGRVAGRPFRRGAGRLRAGAERDVRAPPLRRPRRRRPGPPPGEGLRTTGRPPPRDGGPGGVLPSAAGGTRRSPGDGSRPARDRLERPVRAAETELPGGRGALARRSPRCSRPGDHGDRRTFRRRRVGPVVRACPPGQGRQLDADGRAHPAWDARSAADPAACHSGAGHPAQAAGPTQPCVVPAVGARSGGGRDHRRATPSWSTSR